MGFVCRTGFETSRVLPLAFTFRFLFVLPFRFNTYTPRMMQMRPKHLYD